MVQNRAEVDLFLSIYSEGRETLERSVRGLNVEALDWGGISPTGVVTIGSQLMHIAGFDSMVRSALLGEDLTEFVENAEWRKRYGAGFPRELSVDPPQERPLEYYLDLLYEETKTTKQTVTSLGEFAVDLDGTTIFYQDGKEFQASGLRPHNNRELLFYIPMHDRYHRGQITQQKYNFEIARALNTDQAGL